MIATPADFSCQKLLLKYALMLLGWSVLVAVSLAWNFMHERRESLGMAVTTARASISKDAAFLKWVSSHGGVYVTTSDKNPPNPYLQVPDRDLLTKNGKQLTLINPAYAFRELQRGSNDIFRARSHITSLKPINPDNAADPWEIEAMRRFEQGGNEVMDIQTRDGKSYLRLMQPFMLTRDCLKCHEQQNDKADNVRGGISTEVAMASYQADENQRKIMLAESHGLILLAGMVGLGAFYRRERYLKNRHYQDEAKLHEKDALFRNYFELGQVGMCVMSLGQKWLQVNDRLCEMLGYSKNELTQMTWDELTHPDDLEPEQVQFKRLSSGEIERYSLDKRFIRKNGDEIYTHLMMSCQRKTDHSIDYVIASLEDITERKQVERQVRQLAFYDTLTNLPNRRLLVDRLVQNLSASKRSGCYGALIFIDLDNFKPLNDTYGHSVGDALLVEVSERLKVCVRESDSVSRFGGDEFIVMLSELTADKAESEVLALTVAEKICSSLAESYVLTVVLEHNTDALVEHQCTASIGVAMFVGEECSAENIIKRADTAMYQAKEAGRNSIRFYDCQE